VNKVGEFLLYVGATYYPRAVTGDLVGGFETIGEAKAAATARSGDWAVIVQHSTMEEVCEAEIDDDSRYKRAPVKWVWDR